MIIWALNCELGLTMPHPALQVNKQSCKVFILVIAVCGILASVPSHHADARIVSKISSETFANLFVITHL